MPRRAGQCPVRMLARVGEQKGAAEDARIAPAEVVGEDKDDVERAAGRGSSDEGKGVEELSARHRWGFRRVIVMPSWSWPGRSAQARL